MSIRNAAMRSILLVLLCLTLFVRPGLAVVNGTLAPCNDRRFDCVGLFFTAGTSPGACGGGISGTCVLIAPDQILIKRHSLNLLPSQPLSANGSTKFRARFRRTPSGDAQDAYWFNNTACHGVYQEVFIRALVDPPIPGADTVLAYLERPILNIRPAPLDMNSALPTGKPIILAGWGYTGECFQTGERWSLRYSRGVLPYTAGDDSFWYTPCGIGTVSPCLSCPLGGPWVSANLHDSGAGIFIEVDSPGDNAPELRLIGTVSTTGTAQRLAAFNNAGGAPRLAQTPLPKSGMISDFDRNGATDSTDLFAFLGAYFANGCIADVSMNGVTSVEDVYQYVSAYFNRQ